MTIDPEDNMALAKTTPSTLTPDGHNQNKGPRVSKQLGAGGKLYQRATNRKNGERKKNRNRKEKKNAKRVEKKRRTSLSLPITQ